MIRLRLLFVASLVACGPGMDPSGGPSSGGGPVATFSGGSVADTGGKLFIAWTLDGNAPSAQSCAGIDHLELSLDYAGGGVSIAPIPCTLTRFRYDGLPAGDANLRLSGLDRSDCVVSRGSAPVTLDTSLPASPSPTVALAATRPCR